MSSPGTMSIPPSHPVEALVPTSPCTHNVPHTPCPGSQVGCTQGPALPLCSPRSSLSPEPREGPSTISWAAGRALCPLHSWAGAQGTQQQCWGAAPSPSPLTTPSPACCCLRSGLLGWEPGAPAVWEAPWGCQGGTPRARALQQGPISSLTKAAMQYWRATGNLKLQYLRAARALLTALQGLQTPPSLPQTQSKGPLADPLPGKGPKSNS